MRIVLARRSNKIKEETTFGFSDVKKWCSLEVARKKDQLFYDIEDIKEIIPGPLQKFLDELMRYLKLKIPRIHLN